MPAKWGFKDVPSIVNAADKLVRLALDMETSKKGVKLDGEKLAEVRIYMPDNGRSAEDNDAS